MCPFSREKADIKVIRYLFVVASDWRGSWFGVAWHGEEKVCHSPSLDLRCSGFAGGDAKACFMSE